MFPVYIYDSIINKNNTIIELTNEFIENWKKSMSYRILMPILLFILLYTKCFGMLYVYIYIFLLSLLYNIINVNLMKENESSSPILYNGDSLLIFLVITAWNNGFLFVYNILSKKYNNNWNMMYTVSFISQIIGLPVFIIFKTHELTIIVIHITQRINLKNKYFIAKGFIAVYEFIYRIRFLYKNLFRSYLINIYDNRIYYNYVTNGKEFELIKALAYIEKISPIQKNVSPISVEFRRITDSSGREHNAITPTSSYISHAIKNNLKLLCQHQTSKESADFKKIEYKPIFAEKNGMCWYASMIDPNLILNKEVSSSFKKTNFINDANKEKIAQTKSLLWPTFFSTYKKILIKNIQKEEFVDTSIILKNPPKIDINIVLMTGTSINHYKILEKVDKFYDKTHNKENFNISYIQAIKNYNTLDNNEKIRLAIDFANSKNLMEYIEIQDE